MSELQDRLEQEDAFKFAYLTVNGKLRRQLNALLGDPPDPSNVPPEFWDYAERLQRDESLKWLILIFWRAAIEHGMDQFAARDAAEQWARGRAPLIFRAASTYSQELFGKIRDKPAAEVVDQIFGDTRADRMVITQTTDAALAGAVFAGEPSPDDLWVTQVDEMVCPYCRPLHLRPRSEWLRVYYEIILPAFPAAQSYGPPGDRAPHVNCRCYRLYAFESQARIAA